MDTILAMGDQEAKPQLPPASFDFLAGSLRVQAEMALGTIKLEEDAHPDLDMAKHFIDLMAMLEEKTKGNLTLEEHRFLENSLTELRFRFVQVAGEQSKSKIITP